MPRHRSRTLLRVGASAGALLVSTLVGLGIAETATVTKDVIFVPTPPQVVDGMLELAKLQPGERLIDLGSGDGRIVIAAARHGAKAVGIEIDPELVETSQANAREAGVGDRAEFRNANIFETDLREADVITMYLLPSLNLRLRPTLLDLRPGTRIVTHAFDMDDWRPDEKREIVQRDVYLWIVPARVAGSWMLEREGRQVRIDLRQHFQEVGGSAVIDGQVVPIEDATLRGAELRFALQLDGRTQQLRGRMNGDRLEFDPPWRATRAAVALRR
jgi:SAM-dependent methyltransferase